MFDIITTANLRLVSSPLTISYLFQPVICTPTNKAECISSTMQQIEKIKDSFSHFRNKTFLRVFILKQI